MSDLKQAIGPTTNRPCLDCGGTGIQYNNKVEAGRFGRLELCHCTIKDCQCGGRQPFRFWDQQGDGHWCPCRPMRRRLIHIQRLFKQADIPTKYQWTFQNAFDFKAPDGAPIKFAPEVHSYVATLIDSGKEPEEGFLFYGPPGTGKTLLGCIMLNELILHRGRPGRFLNLSRKYFQQLKDTYSVDSENYGQTWQIIDALCKIPYLVLDDFGVSRGTEWELEMLYDLVDARYSEELFTIVTTNQPLAEIQQLSGGRIYSRLIEMCRLVSMDGEDFRQHLQANPLQ